MTDLPETEEELITALKNASIRHYIRQFGVDRAYAIQLHAFGKNHPIFLIDTLLELISAGYTTEKEKVAAFYAALNQLTDDVELRMRLSHRSLDKTL